MNPERSCLNVVATLAVACGEGDVCATVVLGATVGHHDDAPLAVYSQQLQVSLPTLLLAQGISLALCRLSRAVASLKKLQQPG